MLSAALHKASRSRRAVAVWRALVSLSLLVALVWSMDVDLDAFLASLAHVPLWPLALCVLLRPLAVVAHAFRAWLLLRAGGVAISLRQLWRAHFFGELLARFVPGNLGVVAYVAKIADDPAKALIAQLLDRIYFLLVCLGLCALALSFEGHAWLGLGLVAAGVAGALCLRLLLERAPAGRVFALLRAQTARGIVQATPSFAGRYVTASALAIAVMCVTFWLLLHACGGALPPMRLLLVVMLVTMGSALPVTVNGMGIREWVFWAFLQRALPTPASLLTLSALTYAIGMASSALGVAVWGLTSSKPVQQDA